MFLFNDNVAANMNPASNLKTMAFSIQPGTIMLMATKGVEKSTAGSRVSLL